MSMHVLVCDDDKPTRFVIHRLLKQRMGCDVTECGDGVEAVEWLAAGHSVDLVILDINMPSLDGVDVVEAIRRTPRLAHLPVIMLSHERRQEVVLRLIHLGILGYVAKPPSADSLLALVERARTMKMASPQGAEIRLHPSTPALLADGSAEYRQFFLGQADSYGRVVAVESGLSALAAFKREPSNLVFIGAELGVVGRELLIRKLREMRPDHPLRLVELRERDDASTATPGADDMMTRTMVVAEHRAVFRRFVCVTGPVQDLGAIIGDLAELVTSVSTHVFKTMLDSEVEATTEEMGVADVCATLDITVRHQYSMRVDLCLAKPDAIQIAAGVRSAPAKAVTVDDVTAALTEILTEIRTRLQTAVTTRRVPFECSLPRIRHQESQQLEVPMDGHGLQLSFTTGGARFTLLVCVTKNHTVTHAA